LREVDGRRTAATAAARAPEAEAWPPLPIARCGAWAGARAGNAYAGVRVGEASMPGPPRRARSATTRVVERAGKDLRDGRVSPEERGRRGEALGRFVAWSCECGAPRAVVTAWAIPQLDRLLRDYVQHLFRQGAAVGEAKRVLFAAQRERRPLKGNLPESWEAVSEWESEEPSGTHVPLPRRAYAAAVALCVMWASAPAAHVAWFEMLRALIIGWVGLSRPGELLRLRRRDVVLPSDLGEVDTIAFIIYTLPKGRWSRRAPKHEHVRVDDLAAIRFLETTVGGMHPSEELFPYLAVGGRYRRAWDALFGRGPAGLGFRCRDGDGIVPASLRAGAGCELYARTADPVRFSWLARHLNNDTARRYLQESAAALTWARIDRVDKDRIVALAAAAPALLAHIRR